MTTFADPQSPSFMAALRSALAGFMTKDRHVTRAPDRAPDASELAGLGATVLKDLGFEADDRFRPDPQRLQEALTRRYPW